MSQLEGALVAQRDEFCTILFNCFDMVTCPSTEMDHLLRLEDIFKLLEVNPIARKFMNEDIGLKNIFDECCVKLKEAKDTKDTKDLFGKII